MTIGEIKQRQSDDGSLSNEQWIESGKLHAVGAYQFIQYSAWSSREGRYSRQLRKHLVLECKLDGTSIDQGTWYGPWVGQVIKQLLLREQL